MNLTRASLGYYRHLHLLVALGVAVAVAVLAGAVLVGVSVRASLRDLVVQRLGATDIVVSTATAFGSRLGAAMAIAAPDSVATTTSLIAVTGTVTHATSGRVAAKVQIYGVDDTFWSFHGVVPVVLSGREAALSEPLAAELATAEGDVVIVRTSAPADIPLSTLQGRRDEAGVRIRATVTRRLGADRMGGFALQPGQGPVAAVFVPLSLLQRELNLPFEAADQLKRGAAIEGASFDDARPVLRAVSDTAAEELPEFLSRARKRDGDLDRRLAMLLAMMHPASIPRLMGLRGRVRHCSELLAGVIAHMIAAHERSAGVASSS